MTYTRANRKKTQEDTLKSLKEEISLSLLWLDECILIKKESFSETYDDYHDDDYR